MGWLIPQEKLWVSHGALAYLWSNIGETSSAVAGFRKDPAELVILLTVSIPMREDSLRIDK